MLKHSFFLACSLALSTLPAQGAAQTLERGFGLPLKLRNLDPDQISSDTQFALASHCFASLLGLDAAGKLQAALAASWQTSPDGKTITLNLRPDAVWSDGTPLTAEQAVQSLTRGLSTGTKSDAQPLLLPIKGAQAHLTDQKQPLGISTPSPHTLQLELEHPDKHFLYTLTHPISAPLPMHQITAKQGQFPPATELACSGPYHPVAMDEHHVSFKKNTRYFGTAPVFDEVNFTFAPYAELANQFMEGKLDILDWVDLNHVSWLSEHYPHDLRPTFRAGGYFIAFKGEKNSQLDARIRKILYESIDSQRMETAIKPTLGDSYKALYHLIPWSEAPAASSPPFDMQLARQTMESLGYNDKNPLPVCIMMTDSTQNQLTTNYLRALWAALHIKLESGPPPEFSDNKAHDLPCEIYHNGYGSRLKSTKEIISIFFPGGLFGNQIQPDANLMALYAELTTSNDEQRINTLADTIEQALFAQHLVKPLNISSSISLVSSRVSGFEQGFRNSFLSLSQHLKPSDDKTSTTDKRPLPAK